jgi:hypothetical protein
MRVWARWNTSLICAVLGAGIVQAQSAVLRNGATRAQSANTGHERLLRLLSEPLPGHAAAQAPPFFYNSDSLYEYIDGGADVYLLYNFQVLLHQDFKSAGAELTADIYDMGRPEDAFGMYAAERSPGYNYVTVGIEGYRSKGILNFLQDRYYVKLAGSGAGADALLDQFARTLSARIGGTRTFPPLLQNLPREHRVRHSEQYIRKDPLGHAFLSPAYVVAYASGQKESKLVVSVANDPAAAKARLEQLAKHFKETGECVTAADLGEGGIRGKNGFEGRVMARVRGRYLIVLLNPPENGADTLKAAALSLR